MFKRLIAIILSLVVVFGGMANPAYAYSEGSNTGSLVTMSSASQDNEFDAMTDIVKPLIQGAATFGGMVGVCIAADAAAATVFPPAIAIMQYCPVFTGVFTGGVAFEKTVFKNVSVRTVRTVTRFAY
jgi:uncharacterized secreted protein with C-terminal beta-propeller domain